MDAVHPRSWSRWQRKLLRGGALRGAAIGACCGLAGSSLYFAVTGSRPGPAAGFAVVAIVAWSVLGAIVGRVLGAVVIALMTVLRQFFENVF
ncbi:MAG: hypothetical protein K2R98_10940 [Gemmataceae bacterium]|nr:hypothetical protein [Gemmataceae bacterium]